MAGTIQQIAELAGVSRGTVDRALNHRGRVNAEVAQRIEQIADEMGYITRQQKKAEEQHTTLQFSYRKRIGVVTQLSQSSFMIRVRRGIEDVSKKLARQGIEVILKESATVDGEEQVRLIEELSKEKIDGLAIMPVDCDQVRACLNRLIQENGIPVVTFNTDIVGVDRLCFVGLDNRRSGRAAAGLLAMLMRGRGKVLGITGSFSNSAGSQRMDGFVEELKHSYPQMELMGVQSSFDKTEEVELIVRHAIDAFPDLGGILVVSGGQAGVKYAFEALGMEARPYVILYDLTPKNKGYLEENIVDFVIDQDGYTQGYRGVSLLADKLRWNKNPEKEHMYTDINIKTKYT